MTSLFQQAIRNVALKTLQQDQTERQITLAQNNPTHLYVFPQTENNVIDFDVLTKDEQGLVDFTRLQMLFNFDLLQNAMRFVIENPNALSVSLPIDLQYSVLGKEQDTNLMNIKLNVYSVIINDVSNVALQVEFTTSHNQATYFANIDMAHFIQTLAQLKQIN